MTTYSCLSCNSSFSVSRDGKRGRLPKFCLTCRQAKHPVKAYYYALYKDKISVSNQQKKPQRLCVVCNTNVVAKYRNSFCSDKCARAARRDSDRFKKSTKRGSSGGFRVASSEIHARDKGICYLCGDPVDLTSTDPYSDNHPQIDHVVPVSQGGSHSPELFRNFDHVRSRPIR
jgi:predicted nucleic acid-binding Zn ribbon protein